MPGCAAVGCNNRSEKGYIMKCFPRDPKLRKLWQDRVARADWVPSNNSFLCQDHFQINEWCMTESGKFRLKKDAVPTIFTVTSTRKSPKKRIKLTNAKESKNENACTDIMYLENDTEHSSISQMEEKYSDSQDTCDPSVQSFIHLVDHSPKVGENKQVKYRQFREVASNFQPRDIVTISDEDIEIQDTGKEHDTKEHVEIEEAFCNFVQETNSNVDNPYDDIVIKSEIKEEIDQISLDENYDEIEEKLKQICNDYHEESNSKSTKMLNSNSKSQREVSMPPYKSINYRYSSRGEIGNMLTCNTDNVEIIFGTESGDECVRTQKRASYKNEIDRLDRHSIDINNINNKREICKTSSEDIEETFNKENTHAPNIRAAMKRKWRTREEIKKSIEKSFASSHSTNSMSNSDISDDSMEVENEVGKESNSSLSMPFNNYMSTEPTKFTVKISADSDDIYEIMQGVSKDIKDINIIQKYNGTHEENDRFVTSIITIDDGPVEVDIKDEFCGNDDILSTNLKRIASKDSDQMLTCLSTFTNNQYLNAKSSPNSDNELDDLDVRKINLESTIGNVNELTTGESSVTMYNFEKLARKIKMQENVTKKLNDQLLSSKNAEKYLRNKCLLLEKKLENLNYELNTKTSDHSSSKRTREDLKQKLIDDISNKLIYFEEANKKLMKSMSTESQQKKKFESYIKQRDNRIKELNWKLEKASKYLERAEKNTNTYKRKMLSMQTFIRRKKQFEERINELNQILINIVKQSYIGKTLPTEVAINIKRTCGINDYDKLLSLGFPLPMPSTLQIDYEDTSRNQRTSSLKCNAKRKEYDTQCTKTDAEMDTKDSGIAESIDKEIASETDGTETITGTVQDIFEENNDDDDFSANELTEHFISQLHANM